MTDTGRRLRAARVSARDRAAEALVSRGYERAVLTSDDSKGFGAEEWVGPLDLPEIGLQLDVRVRLPDSFPDVVPDVLVDRARLPRRMAHVAKSGKVCIAPGSNLLLDADRPEAILDDALKRAASELTRGYIGSSDADIQTEFLAYWLPTEAAPTYSICSAAGGVRRLCVARVSGIKGLLDPGTLIADRRSDADAWSRALGGTVTSETEGLFIPLETNFAPPDFDSDVSVREIAATIEQHGDPIAVLSFRKYVEQSALPATVILSLLEVSQYGGRRVVAVRIERPAKDLRERISQGFRPGRVPSWRIIQLVGAAPVTRLNLERVDHAFLTARGGASRDVASATVAVVGVGAIGSEIARNLAALGVGRIHLIDPDKMAAENVHRHALGMPHLGRQKAAAMAADLKARFPHLDISHRSQSVEEVLLTEPAYIMDATSIVLATGEETLERRLNRLLVGGPPRVHSWVEPLGLAGHALACGLKDQSAFTTQAAGCFECLFSMDPDFGLVNLSALTAPGQEIRKSLGGCAGTFSPFSAIDARRSALEAAELVGAIITATLVAPCLVTWRGIRTAFETEGLSLSRRAALISPGTRSETAGWQFRRADCVVCRGAGHGTITTVES